MALVDYSSSDSSSSSSDYDAGAQYQEPPAKKRKTTRSTNTTRASPKTLSNSSSTNTARASPKTSSNSTSTVLPPLPASFHNLYAHTTRPSTTDNPSLHQNRRRVIPHVEGNWPSHISVEWHPSPTQHRTLTWLLDELRAELAPLLAFSEIDGGELTTFLTSDLGAPLPLHISLSRPFVLRTGEKDGFLGAAVRELCSVSNEGFELRVDGLGWFRSREGGRSFLVLRVRSSDAGGKDEEGGTGTKKGRNPELTALLARCNDLVGGYGQPRLYARAVVEEDGDGDGGETGVGDDGGVQPIGDGDGSGGVDDAFHVSIAWSFTVPTPEIRTRTAAVFARGALKTGGVVEDIKIPVTDVKVKIGNVVTSIPLGKSGRKRSAGELFGV